MAYNIKQAQQFSFSNDNNGVIENSRYKGGVSPIIVEVTPKNGQFQNPNLCLNN